MEEAILELDISMDDTLRMDKLKSFKNVSCILLELSFICERLPVLLESVFQVVWGIAVFHVEMDAVLRLGVSV